MLLIATLNIVKDQGWIPAYGFNGIGVTVGQVVVVNTLASEF